VIKLAITKLENSSPEDNDWEDWVLTAVSSAMRHINDYF
jgi:hypothetical protein